MPKRYDVRFTQEAEDDLSQLIIPFGSAGYVALFEIGPGASVNILAVRHQREEDYQ